MFRRLIAAALAIAAVPLCAAPGTSQTVVQSCVIETNLAGTGVAFGAYNPMNPANLTTVWTVYWECPYGQGGYTVTFSGGNSNNQKKRYMSDALGEQLNYNIYADAGFTQILGDGTAGTTTLSGPASSQVNYSTNIYGLLPGGQKNVSANQTFSDWITATINY